jgi:hypothetical protein
VILVLICCLRKFLTEGLDLFGIEVFFILHDILFPALVARQFSASHSFMRRYDCPALFQHVLGSPADPLINVWALDVPDVRVIQDVCIHVVSFPGPGRCG